MTGAIIYYWDFPQMCQFITDHVKKIMHQLFVEKFGEPMQVNTTGNKVSVVHENGSHIFTIHLKDAPTAKKIYKVLANLNYGGILGNFLANIKEKAKAKAGTLEKPPSKKFFGIWRQTLIKGCEDLMVVGLLDGLKGEKITGMIVDEAANLNKIQVDPTNLFPKKKPHPTKVGFKSTFPGAKMKDKNYKKIKVECPINGKVCPACEEDAGWICPWSFLHEGTGTTKCRIISSVKSISWALRKIAREGLATKKKAHNPLNPARKIKI